MALGGLQGGFDNHPPGYPCHRRFAYWDTGAGEGHGPDADPALNRYAFFGCGSQPNRCADLRAVSGIGVVAPVLDHRTEDLFAAGCPVGPLATVQDELDILAHGQVNGHPVHGIARKQGSYSRFGCRRSAGAGGISGAHAFAADSRSAVIALGRAIAVAAVAFVGWAHCAACRHTWRTLSAVMATILSSTPKGGVIDIVTWGYRSLICSNPPITLR